MKLISTCWFIFTKVGGNFQIIQNILTSSTFLFSLLKSGNFENYSVYYEPKTLFWRLKFSNYDPTWDIYH